MADYQKLTGLALGLGLLCWIAVQSPVPHAGLALGWGLCVGSFLNVVAHRLPLMRLRSRAQNALGRVAEEQRAQRTARVERWLAKRGLPPLGAPFSLSVPRSRCPRCGHAIAAWENIPVLSYVVLRGRCRGCALPISWRYPLVELLCGFLTIAAVLKWGWSPAGVGLAVLSWLTLPVVLLELQGQRLPRVALWAAVVGGVVANLVAGGIAQGAVALLVAIAGWAGVRLATSRWPMRERTEVQALAALGGAWAGTVGAGLLIGLLALALAKLTKWLPGKGAKKVKATVTLVALFGWLFYVGVRHV